VHHTTIHKRTGSTTIKFIINTNSNGNSDSNDTNNITANTTMTVNNNNKTNNYEFYDTHNQQ